jgi:AcrR family transcriptional regulator
MAPDERRAAIVAATLPLLRRHGINVTTRQIAEAAGVAEGTIFGVFPDKNSLIVATLLGQVDPERARESLRACLPAGDLRQRLRAAVDHLSARMRDSGALFGIARNLPPEHAGELFKHLGERRILMQEAIAELFEPDRLSLMHTPATCARLLMSMLFANTQDEWAGGETLGGEELVGVLLDGLLVRPAAPTNPGDHS